MFRRSYVQKIFVQKVLCSGGILFRKCYVWKVLCPEGPVFRISLFRRAYVGTHFHLSVSGIKHFFISVHFTFLFYLPHNFIIHFFLGYTRMSSEDPTFSKLKISKIPKFFGNPNEPKLRCSEARRHAYAFLRCVFFIID